MIKIPLSRPYFDEKDIEEVLSHIREVLRSGWLTCGPLVKQFEDKMSELLGVPYVVALNSCTAALHALMLALDVGPGDEVIVPSITFVATANAVLYVGAKPVFADSDPRTFNISPESVQGRVGPRTKGIIAVHLGGTPCDMKAIMEIAEDHKLFVVEDAAHALGSFYNGRPCGTIGIAGAFSFYPTKIITTAEGGAVTTYDEVIAKKVRMIRNHGRAYFGPGPIETLGFNFRLSELHAALGLVQLKHIEKFIARRNEIARLYNRELKKIGWIRPQEVPLGCRSSYYAYIVCLSDDAPITRDELISRLRERGIETSVMYHAVHLQPFYRRIFGFKKGYLPVAEFISENNVALPMFYGLSDEDVRRVIEAIEVVPSI